MKLLPSLFLLSAIMLALNSRSQDDFGNHGFDHYHAEHGWGTTEGHDHIQNIGSTHGGIVVDQDGLIYISSQNGIFIFNEEGALQNSIQDEALSNIHAMALQKEDGKEYIYGARDTAGKLVKFDTAGTLVMEIPFPEESGLPNTQYKPTAVAVKPNGHILLADGYGSNIIFEFDANGKYQSHFGGKDDQDITKFKTPHGLAIDTRYEPVRLLVCDREKRRLVHFDLAGNFIEEVVTELRRPCAVSIKGDYVAVAELQGRVVILDGSNKIISKLGDNPNKKQWANFKVPTSDWQENIFTAPHGICWDSNGNLYVQDWNKTGRVTKWTPAIQ